MASNMTNGPDLQELSPSERAAAVEAAEERVRRESARSFPAVDTTDQGEDSAVANAVTPDVEER